MAHLAVLEDRDTKAAKAQQQKQGRNDREVLMARLQARSRGHV